MFMFGEINKLTMNKSLYILVISFLFFGCKKDECKTCGTWYTIDSDLTPAEQVAIQAGIDDLMQMSENLNSEFCGDDLKDMEQLYDAMGSSATVQMSGYTTTQECR